MIRKQKKKPAAARQELESTAAISRQPGGEASAASEYVASLTTWVGLAVVY